MTGVSQNRQVTLVKFRQAPLFTRQIFLGAMGTQVKPRHHCANTGAHNSTRPSSNDSLEWCLYGKFFALHLYRPERGG